MLRIITYPLALLILLTQASWCAPAQGRWKLQYFYDEDRASLTITDLAFPSAQRGIAVGYVTEKDREKPTAVVTSDGGAHWSLVPLKATPLSVFFLNDSVGWVVTSKGIFMTEESGRSWRKVPKSPDDVLRVYFLDERHGWAVGAEKSVYQTIDGGENWTPVEAAAQPKTTEKYTVYDWITFASPQVGMIAGWSQPPRQSEQRLPDWVEPEKAMSRQEWPHLSITLDTRNGGETWLPSTVSMFGRISRVRLAPDGNGLALVEFSGGFPFPSEVYKLDWHTGKSTRAFRQKDRSITDVLLFPEERAYLVATEVHGQLRNSPIPRKLKILQSTGLSSWTEMEVDYRANAVRAVAAASDPRNVWVATDTGMILKLEPQTE